MWQRYTGYGTGIFALTWVCDKEGAMNLETMLHYGTWVRNRFPRHMRGISAKELEKEKVVNNWGSALECR